MKNFLRSVGDLIDRHNVPIWTFLAGVMVGGVIFVGVMPKYPAPDSLLVRQVEFYKEDNDLLWRALREAHADPVTCDAKMYDLERTWNRACDARLSAYEEGLGARRHSHTFDGGYP